jgi:uncharacterized phosphosugar-binding protein
MLAEKYNEIIEKAIPGTLKRLPEIKRAAEMVAEAVNRGKRIFIVDRYGVIDSEVAEKPAGLLLFRPLVNSGEKLMEGDILFLSSFQSEDEKDMGMVKEAHDIGAKVISISPDGQLAKNSDFGIIDLDGEMNAVLNVDRAEFSFAPLNGIIHVLIIYMIEADTVERLMAAGKKPSVSNAEYMDEGVAKLLEVRKKFASQGY